MSPPHMCGREQELVAEVFASNWIAPVGPHIEQFEQEFARAIGTQHAAALASGTAAIHLALRHLQLQPGDEVICSTFTFCASANPILYEHARPVFIDSDATSWNMDPQLLADELAECARRRSIPKAIVVVDILGQSADMDAILDIARRYEIPVIEDAAEALGATYRGRPAGSSGWANAFSFNGNKIITTSGGGMLGSNDERLIENTRFLATQARDPRPYYHHSSVGYNYRLSNLLAAVGLGQLSVLADRVRVRRQIFAYYREQLADIRGISFMPRADYGEPNCWLSVIQVDPTICRANCDEVRIALESENIESRRAWLPLHQQPVYAGCRARGGKVAEQIFDTALCLPSGSALSREDLTRIVACVRRTLGAG